MHEHLSSSTLEEKTLKFDINTLLMMYNEIDRENIGFIDKKSLQTVFDSLGIQYTDYAELRIYKNA